MADAQNKLFSVNGGADALGKDRRTLDRALVGVPPDGFEGGHPRYRLSTIVRALERRRGDAQACPHADEIEHLAAELRSSLDRLAAEVDIARRRELARKVGPAVGALDRAMQRANAGRPEAERGMLDVVRDIAIGRATSALLDLCQWQIDPTGRP